jgi:hypothetical protein
MTESECAHVEYVFHNAKSGEVSFGSVVDRIAKGWPQWELREGVPPYEEYINH